MLKSLTQKCKNCCKLNFLNWTNKNDLIKLKILNLLWGHSKNMCSNEGDVTRGRGVLEFKTLTNINH